MSYKDSLILYLKMILLGGIIYLILILIPQLCIDKRNTILISIIIVGCIYILYINNNINECYTNIKSTNISTEPPSYNEKNKEHKTLENINQNTQQSQIKPINPINMDENNYIILNELYKIIQNPTPTTQTPEKPEKNNDKPLSVLNDLYKMTSIINLNILLKP